MPDIGGDEGQVIDANTNYKKLPEVIVVGAKTDNEQASEVCIQ